jgi:hypothetical protein
MVAMARRATFTLVGLLVSLLVCCLCCAQLTLAFKNTGSLKNPVYMATSNMHVTPSGNAKDDCGKFAENIGATAFIEAHLTGKRMPSIDAACFDVDYTGQPVCLPSVVFISPHKSGTADTYQRLVTHPNFFYGDRKESHIYGKSNFQDNNQHYSGRTLPGNAKAAYSGLTVEKSKKEHLIGLDASATNMFAYDHKMMGDCTVPMFISLFMPDVRYVAFLRDPVARTYSDLRYFRPKAGPRLHDSEKVKAAKKTAFERAIKTQVDAVDTCIKDHDTNGDMERPGSFLRKHDVSDECRFRRDVGWSVGGRPVDNPPRVMSHGEQSDGLGRMVLGSYYIYLRAFYAEVKPEQIYIECIECVDTHTLLPRLVDWLGYDSSLLSNDYDKSEHAHATNGKNDPFLPLSDSTRDILRGFFAPWNAKLGQALREAHPARNFPEVFWDYSK